MLLMLAELINFRAAGTLAIAVDWAQQHGLITTDEWWALQDHIDTLNATGHYSEVWAECIR